MRSKAAAWMGSMNVEKSGKFSQDRIACRYLLLPAKKISAQEAGSAPK
jgi:hypothetical protein